MVYVLLALFLFSASVMTHILYCRVTSKTGLHAKAHIFFAFLFLLVYILMVLIIGQTGALTTSSIWGLPFKITAGVIFVLLVPVYLCFYVLTQLTSPSKKIMLTIASFGGASYADILRSVQEEDFIHTRLSDLEKSGCVAHVQGCYRLSPSGRKIAGVLNMMQSVLGRGMGG